MFLKEAVKALLSGDGSFGAAMFVSGKYSCGAGMMCQPAKALCAQAKGLGFGTTKRKPKLV